MLVYLAVSHMREDKKTYPENVVLIDGDDSYAISKEEWTDNVDFCAAITYIYIGLYCIFYSLQVGTRGKIFRITIA